MVRMAGREALCPRCAPGDHVVTTAQEVVMFGLFDPKKKLQRQYERKLAEAHDAMNKRGDRALHAKLTAEAETIRERIEALASS